MDPIVFLCLLALVFFFVEIFTPGGIAAGIGTLLLVIASFTVMVQYGLYPGFFMLTLTAGLAVAMFFLEIRILERSPFLTFLQNKGVVEGGSRGEEPGRETLVGQRGQTITTLSPLGKVEIDGALHEAASMGAMLAAGTPIQVTKVEAFRLVVKPAPPKETEAAPPAEADTESTASPENVNA